MNEAAEEAGKALEALCRSATRIVGQIKPADIPALMKSSRAFRANQASSAIINHSPRLLPDESVYHPLSPLGAEDGCTEEYRHCHDDQVNARFRTALFGTDTCQVRDHLVTTFDGRILHRHTCYSKGVSIKFRSACGAMVTLPDVESVISYFDQGKGRYLTSIVFSHGAAIFVSDTGARICSFTVEEK